MHEKTISQHSRFGMIFMSDLFIQSSMKSKHTVFVYNLLVMFTHRKSMIIADGKIIRQCFPKQKTLVDMFPNFTEYRLKTAIQELKNIGCLEVKKRMGQSAMYILKTPVVDKTGDHDRRSKGEHVAASKGEHVAVRMGEHVAASKGEHVAAHKRDIKEVINKRTLTKEDQWDFLFE